MRYKKLLILFCSLFTCWVAEAQNVNSLKYYQATEAYEKGNFEQSDSILISCVDKLKGEEKIGAYRMLALSSLYQNDSEAAEQYTASLLAIDPFYTAYGDSPRFSDLLARLKKGKSTITTASKVAETIEEVPVPVTLITEEMIKAAGGRTLNEVLALYVPGMSLIGGIEDNIAMRGVYGLSQETVLVLQDGHRMNSESTNAYPLDYKCSLDKIKQIEVLRGPASSLYGNVALTAVVNIITKKGSEQEGAQLAGQLGSFDSKGVSFQYGNGNLLSDIFVWGSIFGSKGEKRQDGDVLRYIDGYNTKPAYDLGAKMRWGDFNIEVSGQHSKKVPYYNMVEVASANYDSYCKQSGEKPGLSRTSYRLDLDYSKTLGNVSFSLSGYGSVERLRFYNVLGDSINPLIAALLLRGVGLWPAIDAQTEGVWQNIDWDVYSFGGSASATIPYKWKNMSGSLVGGLQYEIYSLSDARFTLGTRFNTILYSNNSILSEGSEHTFSAYLQLKHRFSSHFIFNGGLRYDHKNQFSSNKMDTFSPRVSLIWLPNKNVSVKAGYSHSFVDAPYFYRASTVSIFSGGPDLKPEKMDAFQIGANWNFDKLHLKYEVNAFYNSVCDLIYYNPTGINIMSSSSAQVYTFANAGKINMGGIESIFQYNGDKVFGNLNLTYQYPFAVENFSSTYHHLSNVPRFLLNMTSSQRVYSAKRAGSLWLRENVHFQGGFERLDNDLINKFINQDELTLVHQAPIITAGAGVEWRFPNDRVILSFDGYNLTNCRYKLGGNVADGIPIQGRSILGRIQVKF